MPRLHSTRYYLDSQQDHVAIRKPPSCRFCGRSTTRFYCREGNRNGNANRLFYLCYPYGQFACFGDMRGVLLENPACFCNGTMQFSRLCLAGLDTVIPRSLFYHCTTGGCDFFEYKREDNGEVSIYHSDISPNYLARIGLLGPRYGSLVSSLYCFGSRSSNVVVTLHGSRLANVGINGTARGPRT